VLIAAFAALAAAALFAVATALQHLSAGQVDDTGKGHSAGLGGFATQTLRQPLWAIGLLANAGGLALHAVALREGPLTLVQPLLVSGVVFALPLRHALEHLRPNRDELGWAMALAAGLTLFIVLASPGQGTQRPPDVLPTALFGGIIVLGIIASGVGGWYTSGARAAALMATAAALAFAGCAGLLKQVVNMSSHGLSPVVTTWPLYALLGGGAVGLVLNQLAYQAGPLRWSLPVVTTVDPIVSLLIGIAVFDEPFRTGAPYLFGEATGLAIVVVAAVALSRGEPGGPSAFRTGKGRALMDLSPPARAL